MKGTVAQRIRAVFGLDGEAAVAIATLASGLDPRTINRGENGAVLRGLFQVPSTYDGIEYPFDQVSKMFDSDYNIAVAKSVFDKHGWGWSDAARSLGLDAPRPPGSYVPGETPRKPVTTTFLGSALAGDASNESNPALAASDSWTRRASFMSPTTGIAQRAYGNTYVYAIAGENGAVWTANNPTGTWTPRTSGLNARVSKIVFGKFDTTASAGADDYGFVAVDEESNLSWSVDGVTWTAYQAADFWQNWGYAGRASITSIATNGAGRWVLWLSWPEDWRGAWPFYTSDIKTPGALKEASAYYDRMPYAGYCLIPGNDYATYDGQVRDCVWWKNAWFAVGENGGCYMYSSTVDGSYWYRYGMSTGIPNPNLYCIATSPTHIVVGGSFGRTWWSTDPYNLDWTAGATLFGGADVTGLAVNTTANLWVATSNGFVPNVDMALSNPALTAQPYGGGGYPDFLTAHATSPAGPWTSTDEGISGGSLETGMGNLVTTVYT